MIEKDLHNEDTQVAALLSTLPRVNAPADFNFRVKASIASGARRRAFRLAPAIGFAAPAVVALGVGAYWFLQPPPANRPAADVAATETVLPIQPSSPPTTPPQTSVTEPERSAVNASEPQTPRVSAPTSRNPTSTYEGGSIDSAAPVVEPKYPRGIDPNAPVLHRPKDMLNPALIPARDVLTSLGAVVEFSGDGYRVSSVRASSVAEDVGVKAGDVVESINDQRIEKNTAFKSPFSGKSIRVNREGISVEIDLTRP